MRHWNQASGAIRAPICNPAVVRPAHRLRIVGVFALGFPGKVKARVDNSSVEAFEIETLDPVLGVGGAERQVLAVPYARIELAFFTGHLAHLRNRAEVATPID